MNYDPVGKNIAAHSLIHARMHSAGPYLWLQALAHWRKMVSKTNITLTLELQDGKHRLASVDCGCGKGWQREQSTKRMCLTGVTAPHVEGKSPVMTRAEKQKSKRARYQKSLREEGLQVRSVSEAETLPLCCISGGGGGWKRRN